MVISDLNGSDSAAKLRILSSIAFNTNISKNKILTEGIQNINLTDILYAKKFGYIRNEWDLPMGLKKINEDFDLFNNSKTLSSAAELEDGSAFVTQSEFR